MWVVEIQFHSAIAQQKNKSWTSIRHFLVDSQTASVGYEAENAVIGRFFNQVALTDDDGTEYFDRVLKTYSREVPDIVQTNGEV